MKVDEAARRVRAALGHRVAGFCYVASEAIYHLAGGRRAGLVPMVISSAPWPPRRLTKNAVRAAQLVHGTHWWLEDRSVSPPVVIDVTAGQFRPRLTKTERAKGRGCGFMTRRPSLGAREIIADAKRSLAVLILVLVTSCGGGRATEPSAVDPEPERGPSVVLISIDGLRPDALAPAGARNITGLADRGAYTWSAQTIFPSTTLPSHTSMLTGVEPWAHGVTFDEYRPSFQLGPPTVLKLLRAAGRRAALVAGKSKFQQLAADVIVESGDADVVNEALALLPDLDLLVVHLPQVDRVGHQRGWMSADYLKQVGATDAEVGRLLAALRDVDTVIVTADHGGHGSGHGTEDRRDMTIPWVAAGSRVPHRGARLPSIRTVDTAPTVLALLGVAPPPGLAGRAVNEAFTW